MTVRYTHDQREKICGFIKREVKNKEYNFDLGNVKGKYKIVGVKPYYKGEEYYWSPMKYDVVITEFYVMRYRVDHGRLSEGPQVWYVKGYSNPGFSRNFNWKIRTGVDSPFVFSVFGIGQRDIKIDKVKWM